MGSTLSPPFVFAFHYITNDIPTRIESQFGLRNEEYCQPFLSSLRLVCTLSEYDVKNKVGGLFSKKHVLHNHVAKTTLDTPGDRTVCT